MTKEEVFELKKEIVIFKDFTEHLKGEEKFDINSAEKLFNENYNKLSVEDKKWVEEKFNYWLYLYQLRHNKKNNCSHCSGCSH